MYKAGTSSQSDVLHLPKPSGSTSNAGSRNSNTWQLTNERASSWSHRSSAIQRTMTCWHTWASGLLVVHELCYTENTTQHWRILYSHNAHKRQPIISALFVLKALCMINTPLITHGWGQCRQNNYPTGTRTPWGLEGYRHILWWTILCIKKIFIGEIKRELELIGMSPVPVANAPLIRTLLRLQHQLSCHSIQITM